MHSRFVSASVLDNRTRCALVRTDIFFEYGARGNQSNGIYFIDAYCDVSN